MEVCVSFVYCKLCAVPVDGHAMEVYEGAFDGCCDDCGVDLDLGFVVVRPVRMIGPWSVDQILLAMTMLAFAAIIGVSLVSGFMFEIGGL